MTTAASVDTAVYGDHMSYIDRVWKDQEELDQKMSNEKSYFANAHNSKEDKVKKLTGSKLSASGKEEDFESVDIWPLHSQNKLSTRNNSKNSSCLGRQSPSPPYLEPRVTGPPGLSPVKGPSSNNVPARTNRYNSQNQKAKVFAEPKQEKKSSYFPKTPEVVAPRTKRRSLIQYQEQNPATNSFVRNSYYNAVEAQYFQNDGPSWMLCNNGWLTDVHTPLVFYPRGEEAHKEGETVIIQRQQSSGTPEQTQRNLLNALKRVPQTATCVIVFPAPLMPGVLKPSHQRIPTSQYNFTRVPMATAPMTMTPIVTPMVAMSPCHHLITSANNMEEQYSQSVSEQSNQFLNCNLKDGEHNNELGQDDEDESCESVPFWDSSDDEADDERENNNVSRRRSTEEGVNDEKVIFLGSTGMSVSTSNGGGASATSTTGASTNVESSGGYSSSEEGRFHLY